MYYIILFSSYYMLSSYKYRDLTNLVVKRLRHNVHDLSFNPGKGGKEYSPNVFTVDDDSDQNRNKINQPLYKKGIESR